MMKSYISTEEMNNIEEQMRIINEELSLKINKPDNRNQQTGIGSEEDQDREIAIANEEGQDREEATASDK